MERYFAIGTTDYLGPFESEDQAYDKYLEKNKVEPEQIMLGKKTKKGIIEGQVIWEREN